MAETTSTPEKSGLAFVGNCNVKATIQPQSAYHRIRALGRELCRDFVCRRDVPFVHCGNGFFFCQRREARVEPPLAIHVIAGRSANDGGAPLFAPPVT